MKKYIVSLLLVMALCLTIFPAAASGSATVVLKIGCNRMAVNDAVVAVDDQSAAVKMTTAQTEPFAESGGTTGTSFSGGSSNDQPRIRCTFVGCDDGKVECSACDGDGGKYVYDNSTPNYDGTPSHGSRTWENCYKCHGTGETACTRCGGDGWID